VGIHPGGRYPSQRWPLDKFSQLADMLVKKYKAKILIVGGVGEENLVDKIQAMMQEKAVKIKGLSLDKLVALIAQMDLLICNNSGPLHIAVSLKIPTVSTMGPTDPEQWLPVGSRNLVVRHDLACSPCDLGFCRRHECMNSITVTEMEKMVSLQLDRINKR
jgi:ADP-heptose:LPS heptosyltransferase